MQDLPALQRWNLAKRIAFRFVFSYFSLFLFTSLVSLLPFSGFLTHSYTAFWDFIVVWLERHALHTGYEIYLPDGKVSNTAYGTILFFCFVTLAAVAAVVWSLLDRRRADYERLHQWLRLLLRWSLAVTMIHYGIIKAIPSQMTAPLPLSYLTERVGELTPMRMLWMFMGSSPAYESFTGCAELLGGVLLLFPRTTLLGALVSFADMVMVVTLNLCYDVHVKLLSMHLLVMSFLLIAPDLRRLTDLLIFNRRVEPAQAPPLSAHRWLNRSLQVLVLLLGLYTIGTSLQTARAQYVKMHPPRPLLYGVWSVEEFVVDGRDVPLFTDPQRWRSVTFSRPGKLWVELQIGSSQGYALDLDMKNRTMVLGQEGQSAFSFKQPAADVLILDGRLEGHRTQAKLRKMALISTGLHWIFVPPEEDIKLLGLRRSE
jgi:uncharacterized membrane protein YphA (DoxX/SURF4 family)